tara:strand:- start:178 stop:369 length:192 start_codon:yes stop_codon:yes gene_type:complete
LRKLSRLTTSAGADVQIDRSEIDVQRVIPPEGKGLHKSNFLDKMNEENPQAYQREPRPVPVTA